MKLNKVCKELGASKLHRNSVPLSLPEHQIEEFLKESVKQSKFEELATRMAEEAREVEIHKIVPEKMEWKKEHAKKLEENVTVDEAETKKEENTKVDNIGNFYTNSKKLIDKKKSDEEAALKKEVQKFSKEIEAKKKAEQAKKEEEEREETERKEEEEEEKAEIKRTIVTLAAISLVSLYVLFKVYSKAK